MAGVLLFKNGGGGGGGCNCEFSDSYKNDDVLMVGHQLPILSTTRNMKVICVRSSEELLICTEIKRVNVICVKDATVQNMFIF